ncbi:unnamed protein product [Cochlearia groenlandica]
MKMESRDPYVREEFSEPESEEDLSQIHETEEVSLDLNRDLLLSQDLIGDSNCDVHLSKDLTGDSNRDLLLSKDLNGRHPMQTRDAKVLTEMESYSVSTPIETKSTIQEVSFSVMEPCLRSRNASLVVEAAFIFSAQRGHTSGTEFCLWHRWRYKYEFTHKTWQKSKNDTMKHSESFLIDIYNHYGSVKGTKTDMLKSTIQSAMAKSSWRVYIWKTKKILRLGSD